MLYHCVYYTVLCLIKLACTGDATPKLLCAMELWGYHVRHVAGAENSYPLQDQFLTSYDAIIIITMATISIRLHRSSPHEYIMPCVGH